jgi:beta propeller domain-containing protein
MRQRRWGAGRSSVSVLGGLCSLGAMACGGETAAEDGFAQVHDNLSGAETEATALASGQGCDALLADLQSNLLAQVSERAAQARISADTYYGGGVFIDDVAPAFDSAPLSAPAQAPRLTGSSGFSLTTSQVPGIDEGDFVKAEDGRIYLVQGQTLFVLDAVPANATEVLGTAAIEGEPAELFVRHGEVVVFSRVYGPLPGADAPLSPYYYYSPTYTKLTVLDATGSTPQVIRESYLEGDYSASRREEGVVRAVLSQTSKAQLDYPTITYVDIFGHPRSQVEIDAQVDLWALIATEDIEDSRIEDYLPTSYERVGSDLVQQPLDCGSYYRPGPGLTQAGATRVVALDLDAPTAPLEAVTLLGYADSVYIDQDALLLRQTDYGSSTGSISTVRTNIHLFNLDGVDATYGASGSVSGYISGQYALDQSGGVVRAVTIEDVYAPFPGGGEGAVEYLGSASRIVTLGSEGGSLAELGRTPNFGLNESIYASRFVGDRGYVLSYANLIGTPSVLYALDLSDPTSPAVTGSTGAPGYFNVLLPLPDDQLLGIGQSLDAVGGVNLQLFDVTDASAPAATHAYAYPEAGYSEALYDARAVTFHPDRNIFSFPLQSYVNGVTSLEVFRFSSADGFSKLGSVTPAGPELTLVECLTLLGYPTDPEFLESIEADPALEESYLQTCRSYNGVTARRGLFRDGYVYAVNTSSVAAYSLDALEGPPLSEVALPASYYYPYPLLEAPVAAPPPFGESVPAPAPSEPESAPASGEPATP